MKIAANKLMGMVMLIGMVGVLLFALQGCADPCKGNRDAVAAAQAKYDAAKATLAKLEAKKDAAHAAWKESQEKYKNECQGKKKTSSYCKDLLEKTKQLAQAYKQAVAAVKAQKAVVEAAFQVLNEAQIQLQICLEKYGLK